EGAEGVGLRPGKGRHRRERGSARGQMQELPSVGKFHFEPPFTSLDHLIHGGEKLRRHFEAECSDRLHVDVELEFGGLHHRQVDGLRPFKDFAGIDASLAKRFREIGSVAHQRADCHIITQRISGRNPPARSQNGKLHCALWENASPATKRASGRSRSRVAKAASISPIVVALRIWICRPMAGAASCTICNWDSVDEAFAGLRSTATRTALGTKSCRSRSRFAANSTASQLMPVRLPPGRARLATRPSLPGSSPTPNTIGIVVVAALAASEGTLPAVAITATCRRTRSAISAGRRSCWPSSQWYSRVTFWPSMVPV